MNNGNGPDAVHLILGALFATSEALSLIPGVQSKGVFQFIYNTLKSLVG